MKLIGIIIVILVVLTYLGFSPTVVGKTKVCQKSEKGFWKGVEHSPDITSLTDVDTLLLIKTNMQMRFNEVEILCETVDKEINTAYKNRLSQIQDQIDVLKSPSKIKEKPKD